MSWFDQFRVTQAFGKNGEQGTDFGVPFHTPVPLAYGGTVKTAKYGPYGGLVEVVSQLPGLGPITEQFIHLDQIGATVVPGAQLPAGSILGLSGGEHPGLPGALHPALPAYSTGPHIEFAVKTAGGFVNPQSILQAFDPSWIARLFGGGQGVAGAVQPAAQALSTSAPDLFAQAKAFLIGSGERIAFFWLAGMIILMGIVLLVWEPASEIVGDPVMGAVKQHAGALKDAAKAAVAGALP